MSPEITAKRARSADQKFERRQAILEAAELHLREVGFEAFSMASLAKSLGLAKGTLYLYFHTREEVFLSLSAEQVRRWTTALALKLYPDMDDTKFCAAFYDSATSDPTLITLMYRLSAIIEHNVSLPALIASKRTMRDQLAQLSAAMSENLLLTPAHSAEALTALAQLLIGTAQSDHGPVLQDEDIPEDLRDFVSSFSTQHTFLTNARRILSCIRAGQ